MTQTEDGYQIYPGMQIWAIMQDKKCRWVIIPRIVKEATKYKVVFTVPDETGYVGARIQNTVFAKWENATNALKKRTRFENGFF